MAASEFGAGENDRLFARSLRFPDSYNEGITVRRRRCVDHDGCKNPLRCLQMGAEHGFTTEAGKVLFA